MIFCVKFRVVRFVVCLIRQMTLANGILAIVYVGILQETRRVFTLFTQVFKTRIQTHQCITRQIVIPQNTQISVNQFKLLIQGVTHGFFNGNHLGNRVAFNCIGHLHV